MSFTSDDVKKFLGDISVDTNREGVVDNFCKRAADFLNSVESLAGSKDVSVDGEDYSINSEFSVFDGGLSRGRLYVSGSFDISDDYTGDSTSLNISYVENMVGDPTVELNGKVSSLDNIKLEIEGEIQGIQNEIEGSYEKEDKMRRNIKNITEAILAGEDIRESLSSFNEEDVTESQSLDPEEKDIARAEKLKTQNSRFALKQACSIQDKAKMIRRMKAVGKICGLDSEQYEAFKYAAKGFLSPDEVAEIEVFVKAA